jgi:hypothetical protein
MISSSYGKPGSRVNSRAAQYPGPPWSWALLGAIEFLGDEPGVPGKDRVGFAKTGHLLEGLLAQLLANLRQRLAFPIAQSYAAFDLLA